MSEIMSVVKYFAEQNDMRHFKGYVILGNVPFNFDLRFEFIERNEKSTATDLPFCLNWYTVEGKHFKVHENKMTFFRNLILPDVLGRILGKKHKNDENITEQIISIETVSEEMFIALSDPYYGCRMVH